MMFSTIEEAEKHEAGCDSSKAGLHDQSLATKIESNPIAGDAFDVESPLHNEDGGT